MGELGALFNPGMRHELEERRAKAARREEEGNARDDDLRIDLDSGVAVINTPGADAEGADPADAPDGHGAADSNTLTEAEAAVPPPAGTGADSSTESGAGTDAAPAAGEAKAAAPQPRGKRAMAAHRR